MPKHSRSGGCIDCGGNSDWFMVTDEVWEAAGLPSWEFCCLACLERRLKRPLTIGGFTVCPLNLWFSQTPI